jgi:hypothetical protein
MRWTRLVPLSSGHHFLTTKHLPKWETEILFGKPNSLNRSFGACEAFSPNPNSLTPKTILKARDGHQNRSVPQLLRSGNLDPTVLVGEVQCTPASCFDLGFMCSKVPLLRGRYSASSLLRTSPPPSRLPSVSGGNRLSDVPCFRRFLGRDEDGFSSCSACPCYRAVSTTPPE